ncbi:MAG: serine hydrolase [Comamonas sp.]
MTHSPTSPASAAFAALRHDVETTLARLGTPEDSTPEALGLMRGFPPRPEGLVLFERDQMLAPPWNRWSFSHIRELLPTANVWRGNGAAAPLPAGPALDLAAVRFTDLFGQPATFAQMVRQAYTDGLLILHRGRVVHEQYAGELRPERPHLAMSITKSVVGMVAATLAHEGVLALDRPVAHYVPELGASAWADATLLHLLEMTAGVAYSEDYHDPDAQIWRHAYAGRMRPRPAGYQGPLGFCASLQAMRKEGQHGAAFSYKTVNTEVLAWVLARVTGLRPADLISTRLWQPMGAEHDAYVMLDDHGTEAAGGGLCTTLRDLARFGETMRCDGHFNGRQVIPQAVVAEVRRGGDREQFARAPYTLIEGGSYHYQWWHTHNAHGAYMGRGIFGQSLYIDPRAELVIARYAAHPLAASRYTDPLTLPACHALALHLLQA